MERQEINIIHRILGGATEEYRILMDRYSSRVFSLIVRIIDNTEDAEEVTQDVFVKAFNALPRFDGRSSFATWLFRIAYNEAVSTVRRKRRSVISMDDSVLRTIADENVDRFFDSDDPRLAALSDAIELLSSEERALLSFYYYEGFPISKAADIMNISESAAKVRLMRIRKKLYILINEISRNYE